MPGCNYTGPHFGAHYDDATCIDGYLWDLDSGEDGMLSSGGDMPCPACNLERWVAEAAEEAHNGALNSHLEDDEPYRWLSRVLLSPLMRRLHGTKALEHAGKAGLLNVPWYGDEGTDVHDDPLARIAWPWPLPDTCIAALTAHERLAMEHALSGVPAPEGFVPDAQGRLLGPLRPADL